MHMSCVSGRLSHLRFLTVLFSGVLLLTSACPARAGDEARVMEWRQYPVPHGTPETQRPPDEAFLKLIPDLKQLGAVRDEDRTRGLVIWWPDYGQNVYSEQPPAQADMAREPALRTPPGEEEPVLLALWGLRDVGEAELQMERSVLPVTVRVLEFEPRPVPGDYFDEHVDGGRVVGFPTYLPEGSRVEVDAGRNAVFWLTVAVPADAAPGRYEIPLRLRLPAGPAIRLPITVEVLPFALPRPSIAYGMYFRPSAKTLKNPRDRTPERRRYYWRDMARHGMTSATLYNYTRLHDAEGALKLDGVPIFEDFQDMFEAGLVTADVPVMFLDGGGIDLKHPRASEILAAFKAEIARRGWPEFLYYGPDEPAVNEQSLANFRALQSARKHFRIITAISDHAAAAYADLLDVYVVNLGRTSPEIQALVPAKGVELWNYTCHNRGRGNAPMQRHYAGLYTWALRLTGNFIWAYTENYTREKGQYLPWSPIYCYVVPSDEGVVPSVAWELRREGVEDYRLLTLLETMADRNPERATARRARAWLAEIRQRVDWYVSRDMPPSLYPWDGPELHPLCPDFAPSESSEIRRRALDFVLQLRARAPAALPAE